MIGYYVHHQGSGHRHRALVLARTLDEEVVGLSSAPPPVGWPGEWIRLASDLPGESGGEPMAGGRLHWAPLDHAGLRARSHAVSRFLDERRPRRVVVDVSVEVCALVRLHGVPVVSVVLPGRRGDAPHRLGFDMAGTLVGFWPAHTEGMLRDVGPEVLQRLHAVGGLSRFPVATPVEPDRRHVVVLGGTGGGGPPDRALDEARRQTPGWRWTVLDADRWSLDPYPALTSAAVVVTHAGQNAVAEVAACRRPAIVVPQDRPHHEQVTTASVLRNGDWPVEVEGRFPTEGWAARLAAVAALDGGRWAAWCDGRAAERFAAVIADVRAPSAAAS